MTKDVECGGCKKTIPAAKAKNIEIQGCCSVISVPLCKECWDSYNSKKLKIKSDGGCR